MGRAGNSYAPARRLARARNLRAAELACWAAAAALMLPQLAAMAARSTLGASFSDEAWSQPRREAYQQLLERGGLPSPIGRLLLPRQDQGVPLFSGTDEVALTLGAGHLPETAALDAQGNIAIAGHRDGFFRVLRDLEPGDRLILSSAGGQRTFEVVGTRVVEPRDVWVLEPTPQTTLTLITCYPFYHVGNAPNRYIVRARLMNEEPPGSSGSTDVSVSRHVTPHMTQ